VRAPAQRADLRLIARRIRFSGARIGLCGPTYSRGTFVIFACLTWGLVSGESYVRELR
jgi:hypothetical protein